METKKIKRTFITLVLSFMIFSLFVSLASNSYFIGKILKNNYFFTIELQNESTRESIKEFEKFLIENENVKGVRFLDRDEAFRNLQKELEIVIPKSENPLPNSVIVYFKDENKLHAIQELLDVNPMVREIYIDSNFLQSTQRKISAVNISLFLFLFFALSMYFQISTILRGIVVKDYMILSIKNPQNNRNFEIARNRNLISFIGAAVIGGLIFFNLYVIFRGKFQEILSNLVFQSFNQLVLIDVVAIAFVVIFSWKSSGKLKKEEV
ncbi:permease-like cell division protein FtsX [uncultured Cetobacterium sp.]|uniref:cell division protein FtsX n=1 Tax=uncultured Cetobacterium sp. TaxID=527638 RepID=UPI00263083BF|nr:permease-like cell division protein FtsX [uncultured Cetobacterium sp.]